MLLQEECESHALRQTEDKHFTAWNRTLLFFMESMARCSLHLCLVHPQAVRDLLRYAAITAADGECLSVYLCVRLRRVCFFWK